jgi:hypothetical protein
MPNNYDSAPSGGPDPAFVARLLAELAHSRMREAAERQRADAAEQRAEVAERRADEMAGDLHAANEALAHYRNSPQRCEHCRGEYYVR